tara:strand:- start:43 stop:1047 length:1005 start_codon:yes stop_codon:yes gene_type:complete
MANAAFSPKDFKAWVIEEATTGTIPTITSGLLQLDVDSVAMPSLNPNQNLTPRTSVGRVLHSNDFFQDNEMRVTEVSLSGTYHNDTGHILLMQSACGVALASTVADVTIPTASTTVSGKYGVTEGDKTFTLVLAPPDTTDGYNIVMPGCLCTNFSLSADTGTDGGLYKWSATISSGQNPSTDNTATEAGTAYVISGASAPISIATCTGATTVNSVTGVLGGFSVTIDSPAVYMGFSATGHAAYARAPELSITATTSVKYDSVTRVILDNFNTQSAHDAAGMLTLTQATAHNCSISMPSGVLTNVALAEGDIMMLDVDIKAVNVGGNILAFDLAA